MTVQQQSTHPRRFVDLDDLACPGCGEQVGAVEDVSGGQFSHSDGTELCRGRGGRPGEPVEP